jgi:hypothetical protein
MLAVLASHACADVWQKRHAHLSLDQVLVKLFVRATSTTPIGENLNQSPQS